MHWWTVHQSTKSTLPVHHEAVDNMTDDNVHHLHPAKPPTHLELLADFDTLLADLALDHPDLEPEYHPHIRQLRDRYKTWLTNRHPSTGPDDGGAA